MNKYFIYLIMLISLPAIGQDRNGNNDWAQLKKYAAENMRIKATPKHVNRVVFMGNSITEFWNNPGNIFILNPAYVNRGISGQTTSQMLFRFSQDVVALKPAVVVILGGINDIARNNGIVTLEETFRNIASMAMHARQQRIKVVLSSVLPAYDFFWRPGLQPAPKIIRLNQMIKAYCIKNKIVYVDYYSSMADKRGGLKPQYSDDGVHPNQAGYKIMEPLVQKAIAKALTLKQ